MKSKFSFLYVPCPNQKVAIKLANTLIKEKLVACANILPGMTSIYPWQGKMEKATECLLILKTTQAKKTANRAEKLHPYEIPCVAELKLTSINEVYGSWLEANLI
jgi:periplasmic divalent cation tolerance protein